MIKKALILSLLFLICQTFAQNQSTGYYNNSFFGLTSPGAMKYGLYGFDNPAILSTLSAPDLSFNWTNYKQSWSEAHRYGLFMAVPNLGFSVVNQKENGKSATDYRLSGALGDANTSFGFGYGWSGGDAGYFNRSDLWDFGFMVRPNQYLSLGAVAILPSGGDREGIIEAAIRPLKTEVLSVFGDYAVKKDYSNNEPKWSAGIALEAYPGVRVSGRYFENKTLTAGIQLELGNMGISTQSYFDKDQKYGYNSYGIRMGAYDRNIFAKMGEPNSYLSINMIQSIGYRRYKFFDKKMTMAEILNDIEAAKKDPRVAGIAINTSGMSGNREILWEVREKLKDFKTSGKKVIIYVDRCGVNEYHFASVGDKIVMDPMGMFMFEGYLMGRTYLRGTLDKLGLGYDEFRFFKYKSANEDFARYKMSDADREQRQCMVNDWYRLAKEDIVSSGRITSVQFDSLVDYKVGVLSGEALSYGMVDTLARWDAVEKMITGKNGFLVSSPALENNKLPHDNYWGPKPAIAVIYALGVCAMDEGINARQLVHQVQAAVDDNNVKAIVLRVDSPGGDAMASDYISSVLKSAKGKKPVIVSQGFVAASGGYWLSMCSDTIVAAPSTITGSIGVIGGLIYNKGFKEMTGMSTDFVKKGEHADLGFGMNLPFINVQIPDRDVTPEERAKIESVMKSLYRDFVKNVADGRKKTSDYISTIAEGRIWSGYDGLRIGLVDVLGGLETAIDIARSKAHLKTGEYEVVQSIEDGLIDFSKFTPKLISAGIEENPAVKDLKFRLQFNGQPLFMLPLDFEY